MILCNRYINLFSASSDIFDLNANLENNPRLKMRYQWLLSELTVSRKVWRYVLITSEWQLSGVSVLNKHLSIDNFPAFPQSCCPNWKTQKVMIWCFDLYLDYLPHVNLIQMIIYAWIIIYLRNFVSLIFCWLIKDYWVFHLTKSTR